MPAPKGNTHAQKDDQPRSGSINVRASAQAIADLRWIAAQTNRSQGDVLANLLAKERLRLEEADDDIDPIYEAAGPISIY